MHSSAPREKVWLLKQIMHTCIETPNCNVTWNFFETTGAKADAAKAKVGVQFDSDVSGDKSKAHTKKADTGKNWGLTPNINNKTMDTFVALYY